MRKKEPEKKKRLKMETGCWKCGSRGTLRKDKKNENKKLQRERIEARQMKSTSERGREKQTERVNTDSEG